MFLRMRWFVLGAAASAGALVYVAGRLRAMREALTPPNLARGAARAAADLLEAASDRMSGAASR